MRTCGVCGREIEPPLKRFLRYEEARGEQNQDGNEPIKDDRRRPVQEHRARDTADDARHDQRVDARIDAAKLPAPLWWSVPDLRCGFLSRHPVEDEAHAPSVHGQVTARYWWVTA